MLTEDTRKIEKFNQLEKELQMNWQTSEVWNKSGFTKSKTYERIKWKAQVYDWIYGFCFKRFTTIPGILAQNLCTCLRDAEIPK